LQRSSSSLRRHAHHLHLCATAPIVFIFAPPRPSSSSLRRRDHHLHLRAAAPIIFFAPPRSSSSSSRRRDHHASDPRSSFVWRLGLVNSIHPRHHLFIRLAARGDSIATMPFLHSAGSITAPPFLHSFGRHRLPRHNFFSMPANPSRASNLHRTITLFIFFEPSRSSSSRCHALHLLRAIALIFITLQSSSSSSHHAHLHRAVTIFIFFALLHSSHHCAV